MHAGSCLFRDALPLLRHIGPARRVLSMNFLEEVLDYTLFGRARRRVDPLVAVLHLVALVDQESHITAVVDHHLRSEQSAVAVREAQRLIRAPPELFQRLALPGKHRHAGRCDRRRSMVLRGEDIAARPAHIGAQVDHGLDQHRGLNRHMQRSGNAHALERLVHGILAPNRHQARHLLLGDLDLLAAKLSQRDVRYLVVVRLCAHLS